MRRVASLVIGAGITGLGAALRAHEPGASPLDLEAARAPYGFARSFSDPQEITWDLGSHLQLTHNARDDQLLDEALPPEEWLWHERRSACLIGDQIIPDPIQTRLHHLPLDVRSSCVEGLLRAQQQLNARYEISNQDHSLMQEMESVQHAWSGEPELTLKDRDSVNSRYNPFPCLEYRGAVRGGVA